MRPDGYKELTPVVYGKKAVKWLPGFHKQPGETCFSLHWHERVELLTVRQGEMLLRLGGESHTVRAGQLAIINSCQLHAAWTEGQAVTYDVVMFDLSHFLNSTAAVHQYLPALIDHRAAFLPVTEDREILDTVDRLIALHRETERNPLCAIGEVYRLLGLLLERCAADQQAVHTADEKISAVLSYIIDHATENINTAALSRRFNYSEGYFCRLFRRVTGLTVSAYVRILRLEMAQKLLKETDLNMAAIASRCGFSDGGYFTNCFTRQYGVTPTAFRAQFRA